MDFSDNLKWYTAILNHDFGTKNIRINGSMFSDKVGSTAEEGGFDIDQIMTPVLNLSDSLKDGTTILCTDLTPTLTADGEGQRMFAGIQIQRQNEENLESVNIGAISTGVRYTMPHAADQKLTMSVLNDGWTVSKTSGGSMSTNIRYTGAPNYQMLEGGTAKYINPFGVGTYSDNPYLDGSRRAGRRKWNLSFSFVSDHDLFASNYMANRDAEQINSNLGYQSGDIVDENTYEHNLFTDNSFIAQVWNKTLGGALPFIFQPDSTNENPDGFTLCRFNQRSLDLRQRAYKFYDMNVVIEEIW